MGGLTVVQTLGCVDCGVNIAIEVTLVLTTDQKSKMGKARDTNGLVLAYLLYYIKKPYLVKILKNKLNALLKSTNTPVFIYTSPECLMREP